MRGVTWDGCSYAHVNFNRDSFSVSSRSTTEPTMLRAGPENQPVVRLVAVNRSEVEHAPHPLLGILFHFIISRLIRFLSSSSIVIIYFVLPTRIYSESLVLAYVARLSRQITPSLRQCELYVYRGIPNEATRGKSLYGKHRDTNCCFGNWKVSLVKSILWLRCYFKY